MPRIRASWLIIIAAALVPLAARPLREQLLPPVGVWYYLEALQFPPPKTSRVEAWLRPYRERAVSLAERQQHRDPDMLLGAGLLCADDKRAAALLGRAAETGRCPAARAAFASKLTTSSPAYARIGTEGVIPSDPASVASGKQSLEESKLPDRLSPEAVAPILDALRAWEADDRGNALPVALEVYYLYGLHRDSEALDRWEAASKLTRVDRYYAESGDAVSRLLVRAGAPAAEAAYVGWFCVPEGESKAVLRNGARIAQYEGYLAAMQGRPKDAIRWWRSSSDFGHNMENSAYDTISFLVGWAIEEIGASPTWRWSLDRFTGIPGGPIGRGRFFFGVGHDFYVSQVGAAADAALRDRVVQAKVRGTLIRGYRDKHGYYNDPFFRAAQMVMLAGMVVALALVLLVIYMAIGCWRRRQADDATRLSLTWQVVLALLTLAPCAVSGLLIADVLVKQEPVFFGMFLEGEPSRQEALTTLSVWMAALSFVFVFALPLIAAGVSRQPGARLATAWRGNARKILPTAVAMCALASLGLLGGGARYRTQWVHEQTEPGRAEMATIIKAIGPSWADPTIPLDSWRAEYPPKKPL
jgi:hypothetical protein